MFDFACFSVEMHERGVVTLFTGVLSNKLGGQVVKKIAFIHIFPLISFDKAKLK